MGTTKEEVAVLVGMGDGLAGLPAGFRFHPTDEEIITHYLREKIRNKGFSSRAIGEVDLNRCEPWDLPGKAKMGEKEWYFFCQRDMKYPTGTRTNRATESGYWKATGKDREIHNRERSFLVGMKKTLVFYTGRAPKGMKTNWVMHEYRLEGRSSQYNSPRSSKDDWVVCRVFHKNAGPKKAGLAPEPTTTTTIDPFGMSLDFADDCLGKSHPPPSAAEYSPYGSSSRPCSSLVDGGHAAPPPSAVLLSPAVPPSIVDHQGRRKYFVSSSHLQPANLTEGSMFYPQAPSPTATYGSILAASAPNACSNLHQNKASDSLFYRTASDPRRSRPKVEQPHAYQSAVVSASTAPGAAGQTEICSGISTRIIDYPSWSAGPACTDLTGSWDY